MSRTWVILAIIVSAGLGVRLAYLASDPHHGSPAQYYGELARNLIAGRGFTKNEGATRYTQGLLEREHRLIDPATVDYAPLDRHGDWQPEIAEPPGTGVLLAGAWEITGREYFLPMQILQAILDALCALLIFRISLRLFKRSNAALAAAALYAVYLPVAWQTTVVYSDFWAVDFTIAIVACYLEAIESARPWRWLVICGLLAGAGAYFRPNLAFLPPILALAALAGVGWRRTLTRALVPSAIVLVLLAPWTIRAYKDFHTLIFVRSGLATVMWAGFGQLHSNLGVTVPTANAEMSSLRTGLRIESPAWENVLLKRFVIPRIEHHPFVYAEIVGGRIVRSTLFDYEGGTWMHRGVTLPSGRSPAAFASFLVGHPLALLEDALKPLAFLLSMLTLGLTWRRWRQQHIFLMAVLLSVLVPFIIIDLQSRYILPAACAYVVWIGLGVDLLYVRIENLLRARRARLLVDAAA
jgi:4-amino-4-deoxy-L-arabinose transferase-like glycosyltransferase